MQANDACDVNPERWNKTMTTDTQLAILHTTQPAVSITIAALPVEQQVAILTNGGSVTLATGKSPNGMDCTLVAKVTSKLTADVFAVSADGREQPVAVGNVAKIIAMLAK